MPVGKPGSRLENAVQIWIWKAATMKREGWRNVIEEAVFRKPKRH
jgi:hypothetical protein